MKIIENLILKIKVMKHLFAIFLVSFLLLNCETSTNNPDCNECGGGLLDGYLYKEVTIEDVAGLAEINVSVNIGKCIRFKMDGSEFSEAVIVDDCCCSIYE